MWLRESAKTKIITVGRKLLTSKVDGKLFIIIKGDSLYQFTDGGKFSYMKYMQKIRVDNGIMMNIPAENLPLKNALVEKYSLFEKCTGTLFFSGIIFIFFTLLETGNVLHRLTIVTLCSNSKLKNSPRCINFNNSDCVQKYFFVPVICTICAEWRL
jgi:hypothetical protein